MPPLECANFLECENKTVCVAPFGPLRPSPWIQHQFFSIIYQKIITIHPAELFFWPNGLERDSMWNYRRLTRKLHLPHIPENAIPGDFSQKKAEKNEKNVSFTENEDFMECADLAERDDLTVSTSPAVECDGVAGVWRICGMRRIPSMRGWYRDHIGKFRGQNQNSNPKASPNFQGHTSGFYFSEFTLGEAPGKKLANFYSANL